MRDSLSAGFPRFVTKQSGTRPRTPEHHAARIDFHCIPTKHLDGSAKLPDGSRVESHIEYFNPKAITDYPLKDVMSIDWISGMAKFTDPSNTFGYEITKEFPTTLASTRVTPQMDQAEYLGLTFFQDGKQSRLNSDEQRKGTLPSGASRPKNLTFLGRLCVLIL